ncbi:GNAT family N-acetyltransferase [Dermacoccaceae bacterium W4C1]
MSDHQSTEIAFQLVEGLDAVTLAERVWPCYSAVFGDFDDYDSWRSELFERHAARGGFRLVTARDDAKVVGFGCGYVGRRGQYWSDLAYEALPSEVATDWIGGHFEFVELGILPTSRRLGLGQRLHDLLLDGVTGRCLLSTSDDLNDPAVRLYLRSGWSDLGS